MNKKIDKAFLNTFLDTIDLQTDALSEYAYQKGLGWTQLGEYAEQVDDLVDKMRKDIDMSFMAETIVDGITTKDE